MQEKVGYGKMVAYWTYLYFGYKKGETLGYVRFIKGEERVRMEKVYHMVNSEMQLYVGSRSGKSAVSKWRFERGKGSFRESFAEVEFVIGDQLKEVRFERVFAKEAMEEEVREEDRVNGITEFGVGLWSRFKYNLGEEQVEKGKEYMSVLRVDT